MTSKFNLILAAAALCLFAACSEEKEPTTDIKLSSGEVSITKLGVASDNSVATVEITSNTYWRAFIQEGCDWLSVSPMGGPAGTTTIQITALSNVDGVQRTADISIEAVDDTRQIIRITQGGQGDAVAIIEDSFGEGRDEEADIASVTTAAVGVGISDFSYSSDKALLSKDNPSSGYEGASGGANVLIKAGGSVILNKLTTAFSLQFNLQWGQASGSVLPELYASSDGETWGYIPYSTEGSSSWVKASTKLDFNDDALYRYFKISNPSSEDCRIDDILMTDAVFSDSDYTHVNAVLPYSGVSWNADESLTVFAGARPIKFSYSGTGNDFSTIYSLPQSSTYALYPYDGSATLSGSTISTTLPAEQKYAPESEYNVNMPMVASSSTGSFNLKALAGTVRVKVTGRTTIFKMAVNCDDKVLSGPATISGDVLAMLPGGGHSVYCMLPEGIVLNETDIVNIDLAVPAGTYDNYSLSVIGASGDEIFFKKENLTVSAGQTTEVELFCKELPSNLNMPSYYGESGLEKVYANCYRITKAGEYKFDASTTQGAKVVGVKADWVWATSGVWASSAEAVLETLIGDIEYDSESGSISFFIPENFTPGNVFIAMLDAEGNIQYSWHIWTTLDPQDIKLGDALFMDRNIGAATCFDPTKEEQLHCIASRGFYYHWGCKNPIVGVYKSVATTNTFTMGDGATYYIYNGNVQNTGAWSINTYTDLSAPMSELYAMQHPMTFIATTAVMPHYGEGGTWPETANPCPYGYKVMALSDISGHGYATINDGTAKKNVATVLDELVNFPSCGYRANTTGGLKFASNPDGRYWADSVDAAGAKGDYWLMNASNNKASAAQTNCGFSVRCVRK